jgi:alpha-tubulin suppressor-like RCC1 family protein
MRTSATSLFRLPAFVFGLGLVFAGQACAQTVTHVAAGYQHTIFSKSDGSLWGMGDNSSGGLGLGFTPSLTNVPQEILSSGVGLVAAGYDHTLFQMGNTLWAMGENSHGELGDGTFNPHYFPEQVYSTGSRNFAVGPIAAGGFHSQFATYGVILSSGGLWEMGDNGYGELGDGAVTNHNSPEEILAVSPGNAATAVACGFWHSLFVRPAGSLWVMGLDIFGALGDGQSGGGVQTNLPEMIVSSGVSTVAGGGYFSLFTKSDGSLWGMGDNSSGQLGDSTTQPRLTPEQVVFNGVTAIAAGTYHSLFIKSNGSLWGMGDNAHGELGIGTTNEAHLPVLIVGSNVVAVAAGNAFSLFIKSNGGLWGMGNNNFGQLGTGDYADRLAPVEIVPPPRPSVTSISLSGSNVVVMWPSNTVGFYLQSATNLVPPVSWSGVPDATNTYADQFALTNPLTGSQRFFRLSE